MALEGKVVAITRPKEQAGKLAKLISKLGGEPYVAPTVEIKPLSNERSMAQALNKILKGRAKFVIFMSVNGVKGLFSYVRRLGLTGELLKRLNEATVVAVGPKTRMELERRGVKASAIPRTYGSEGVVESLKETDLRGKAVVVPRSSKASGYLTSELKKLGANVLEVPTYECALPTDRSKASALINDLLKGKIDVVTFTSPSAALNLFKIAGRRVPAEALKECLRKTAVAAIGPVTKRALEKLGVKVDVMPKEYTIEAMVDSLVSHFRRAGGACKER